MPDVRAGWRLAHHAQWVAAVLLSACSLVAPPERNEYELVSVNGIPVPMTLYNSTLGTGELLEYRILAGKLTLFDGGRFAWDKDAIYLIDGAPDSALSAPVSRRLVSQYRRTDTALYLSWSWRATIHDEGRTVRMYDLSGMSNYAVFELRRP